MFVVEGHTEGAICVTREDKSWSTMEHRALVGRDGNMESYGFDEEPQNVEGI